MKNTLGLALEQHPLIENHFYTIAQQVSPQDYQDGAWKDVTPAEGVIYAQLQSDKAYHVLNAAAYFEDSVSADAYSIAVNLYFWSQLTFKTGGELNELATKRFHSLRSWAMEHHPEAGKIYQLID